MSDHEVVLSAKNITKDFYLPHEKQNSIKSAVVNIFKKRDKEADTQHALRGISFDIHKGEFFGILGRNGSGKSTMLKIISEIYQPTSGSVSHNGKLVPFIELGVGFNPELTGRENVYLNGALLGFSSKEIDKRYDEIVEFAELRDFMDQKLKNYSSGMQVRLAFSVATHAEANILVVDEVLAVGDADFQRKCYDYFKSLKKTGKTVVFVTHDMGAVREYCDRTILIENGLVSKEGKPEDVADEYLKLFNNSSDIFDDSAENRWGNGWATIDAISAKVEDKILRVNATIQSHGKDIDEFTFGYRFSNSEGKIIAAGNSEVVENGKTLSLEKDKKVHLSFVMPDFLGNDTYSLGATVRLNDRVTVCDNWESILTIKSVKRGTYYPVWAPATMEAKHE